MEQDLRKMTADEMAASAKEIFDMVAQTARMHPQSIACICILVQEIDEHQIQFTTCVNSRTSSKDVLSMLQLVSARIEQGDTALN